jgi:hypothetical protein
MQGGHGKSVPLGVQRRTLTSVPLFHCRGGIMACTKQEPCPNVRRRVGNRKYRGVRNFLCTGVLSSERRSIAVGKKTVLPGYHSDGASGFRETPDAAAIHYVSTGVPILFEEGKRTAMTLILRLRNSIYGDRANRVPWRW